MFSSFILLPFIGVVLINLPLGKFMDKAAFWLSAFICLLQMAVVVFPGLGVLHQGIDSLGAFLKFNFAIDPLTRVMLFCIGLVAFTAICVERHIAVKDSDKFQSFASLLLLLVAGSNGVVMVRDIFSLYLFVEIVAVASFILIGFDKDLSAFEGAFKYIILSGAATVLMLCAIALLLLVSGETNFSSLNAALLSSPDRNFLTLAIGIFICACLIKSGLMPFHGWLPDSYSSAPAPVSILLAGIVTKTVGVYTLIRITVSVFGFTPALKTILLVVGAFSAVAGAVAALGQNDFKRMLAYSSISQVGYIILGLGSGTALGIAGAVFHLFNHSVFKSLLFLNSAAVELETGTRDLDSLSGLNKKMPLTGITSCLASLSCAGIPPLAGFWSKLIIIIALWMSGLHLFAVIAVGASVLTLAYFLSLQRKVFFGRLSDSLAGVKEAGLAIGFPAVILALLTIGAGLFFPVIMRVFILPIGSIAGG